MSKMIKGLLFDKDGTLFDFRATWDVWCYEFLTTFTKSQTEKESLAEAFGYDLAEKRFNPSSPIIAGTLDCIVDALKVVYPNEDTSRLLNDINKSTALVKQVPPLPLKPLLEDFQARSLKLGVATNDGEFPARQHLQAENIDQYFDFISGYDSGYGAKPDAGMLMAFCEKAGLEPERVAMIGDSTHDLIAGETAGMKRVAVLTGVATFEDLAPYADVVLQDIGEIPNWLDGIS